MTRAEEINVKIVYEIPDTRDPRLVRSRDPSHSLPPRLHGRKLHISSLAPSPTPPAPVAQLAPFQRLFNDHDQSQRRSRHSCEPVRGELPPRERERDGSARCNLVGAPLTPDILHAGCAKSSAGRLIEIEGGPPAASAQISC